MNRTAWCLLLLLVCLSGITPVLAQNDMERLETSTALRSVYFLSDHETELITVGMVILAGEVDVVGPEGLSHYLEHIMFWHADALGNETMHYRGGNAWVNGIITTYYNIGELSELDDMFEFTYRLLNPPASSLAFMQDERKVVVREYDLRVSENPEWRALIDMRKRLYDNHSLGRSVIGTPDSIMSLTVDAARAFHQQYYLPSNAVLLISGNVNKSQVTQWVNNKFSNLDPTRQYTQPWRESLVTGALDETVNYPYGAAKSARLAYTALAEWSGDDDPLQDEYTLQLTAKLLQSALPGSLSKPLRLDNFIVNRYELSLVKNLDQQVELTVLAYPDAGVTLKKVQVSLQEALAQQGINGIPKASLDRIRTRMLQTARRESSNSQIALRRALHHLSLGFEPNTEADHLQRIQAITKPDVDKLLGALGKPQRRVSGLITGN